MPIIHGKDSIGRYVKWGRTGHRYHYYTPIGKERAIKKVMLQARAIAYRRMKN